MPHARTVLLAAVLGLALAAPSGPAAAADPVRLTVTLHNHQFAPTELHAPAGVPIEITVKNTDATPEEFESKKLRVEKVVAGNSSILVRLHPLAAGRYGFVGEYHEDSARGTLVIGAGK